MSFIIALIVTMLVLDLLWWWVAYRGLGGLRRQWLVKAGLHVFMATMTGLLFLVLIGRVSAMRLDHFLPRPVLSAVFLWHFIILPIASIMGLVNYLSQWANDLSRPAEPIPPPVNAGMSRREFISAVTTAAPPVATALTSGYAMVQMNGFRVRPIDVVLPSLPAALDGLRIAQVTDMHVGPLTSARVLNSIIEQTNQLRADLVLLTGDLINHALSDLPVALDAVKRMDARHGVYMCEGNHDLMESRDRFEQRVKRSSVPLLINESTMLNVRGHDVQLLGLRWGPGQSDEVITASVDKLKPQLLAGAFPILLAHHPHAFDPAAKAGIPLTLAGHTHGGQLMLTKNLGFGPYMYRYWSGLYEKGDNKLVVSNGVGNWFPLRINAPAEIVQITLRRASI